MNPALVPELSVTDWRATQAVLHTLGFTTKYERPDEGFAYLTRQGADLMIDQIGTGRDFDDNLTPPLGRGLNLQIRVTDAQSLYATAQSANLPIPLPLEDKWYRTPAGQEGNRQFMAALPDGYLLRFYQDLGTKTLTSFW
ncbi:VOC family protein [Donghicola sp. C2-DW-16]|uniref:VOC family protein n=2 Tax=Donghicola mangrovi TaxID=2729614 RepID=A0ABX2PHV9_9RHOB|nr:VOC family protein [Donghicola mangrovi]NVO28582.1 VOC family protein [Donghicola mangrovi]